MPRPRRSELFDEDNVGIYHCVNRCVRRAFLCGFDAATGNSYAHRKDWVQERLETLAAIFAIDVIGYTSAYDRIHADGSARRSESRGKSAALESTRRDRWLSPIQLENDLARRQTAPQHRASNLGFLSLTTQQYLSLLDWTGREARRDKRGSIPAELAPILERLQIAEEQWFQTVLNFGRTFRTAAGRFESLVAEAARRGRRWLQGMRASRRQFSRN